MKKDPPDYIVQFLIKEIELLNEDLYRMRNEGLTRLNFFIAITTSVLGGLALLIQFGLLSHNIFLFIASGVFLLLLLIGLNTFTYSIARDIASDQDIRATARIRRFFIERHPPVEKYITWRAHDTPTSLVVKNTSNIRRTVQYVLSTIFSLIVGLIANYFLTNILSSIGIGIACLPMFFFVLEGYAKRKFKKAAISATGQIRFPVPRESD